MATAKATKKTATKNKSAKSRKNPTAAQLKAWRKLGLMAKKRAAEARRLNGTKKKVAKKATTVKRPRQVMPKPSAKRLATRATRNPRYLTSALNSAGRHTELGIISAPNKTQALAKAKSLYSSAGYTKFILEQISKEDVIGGTATAAAIRKLQAKRAKKKNGGRSRRNPGEIYETFTGRPSEHAHVVTAPKGTPADIDELGDFVEFKWIDAQGERHTVNLESQGAIAKLAAHHTPDGRDGLYVVAPGELPYFGAHLPAGDVGYIYEITYRAQKTHLGDTSPRLYYHRLGEESGQPPILHIDDEGYMHFKGGEYWIEDRGIIN